ncbi:MAG: LysR family transcriptional regulator [Plesiomonas sp.]|uniref:LysR family transcriptional regulator n=1 Tax=Plesiomonas sp. TaxID=2486279 RepID=UPI003EE6C744
MDYRQLRAFTAVFEEKNMTAAAHRCHISQPALSAAIRQLEDQLGIELFIRQPKGVALTEEARRLYPTARRLVNEINALPDLFAEQGNALSLQIGLMPDLGQQLQSQIMAACYHAIPNLKLDVRSGCCGDMRIDLDTALCDDDLFFPLIDEEYRVAIAPDHPHSRVLRALFAEKGTISASDIPANSWLVCNNSASYQRIMGILSQHSLVLSPKAKTETDIQLAAMINAGLGIGLLPSSALADWPVLQTYTLPELTLSRRIGWCYSVEAAQLPAVQQIIHYFSEPDRLK